MKLILFLLVVSNSWVAFVAPLIAQSYYQKLNYNSNETFSSSSANPNEWTTVDTLYGVDTKDGEIKMANPDSGHGKHLSKDLSDNDETTKKTIVQSYCEGLATRSVCRLKPCFWFRGKCVFKEIQKSSELSDGSTLFGGLKQIFFASLLAIATVLIVVTLLWVCVKRLRLLRRETFVRRNQITTVNPAGTTGTVATVSGNPTGGNGRRLVLVLPDARTFPQDYVIDCTRPESQAVEMTETNRNLAIEPPPPPPPPLNRNVEHSVPDFGRGNLNNHLVGNGLSFSHSSPRLPPFRPVSPLPFYENFDSSYMGNEDDFELDWNNIMGPPNGMEAACSDNEPPFEPQKSDAERYVKFMFENETVSVEPQGFVAYRNIQQKTEVEVEQEEESTL